MIGTTTDLFTRKAKQLLTPRPAPAYLQMSSTVGLQPAVQPVPIGPQPVSLDPKSPDVETIGTSFRFAMQQISIGGHSSSEMRPATSSSLVGGR